MSALRSFTSPMNLEEAFLEASAANTGKSIESCALVCGDLSNDLVRATHLVFPRQSGTENTVEMIGDTAVDMCLIAEGLLELGWIHTHPTQTAFLSSIDMHTQFSYQQLLPEAVAVVCAPCYGYKWLRLTSQGMKMMSDCPFRDFHDHVSKSKLWSSVEHHFR